MNCVCSRCHMESSSRCPSCVKFISMRWLTEKGLAMNKPSSRQLQRGYLLEIPILFMVVVIVMSIVIPKLPPLGQKIAFAIAAIPILFFLFYMIVIPGWTPGYEGRLKWPWNWVVFLLVAIPIIAVVLAILFA